MSSPFAQRARLGFVQGYLQTWKRVALDPARFFRNLRIDETGSAVGFGVISGSIATWFAVLLALVLPQAGLSEIMKGLSDLPGAADEAKLGGAALTGILIAAAILAPLGALISVYLLAGLHHLFLMLFGGARRGFDATLTSVGYSYGLSVLNAVPWLGGLVAVVWSLVAVINGFNETHRCGMGKAVAGGLAPLVSFCCCCVTPGTVIAIIAIAKAAGS